MSRKEKGKPIPEEETVASETAEPAEAETAPDEAETEAAEPENPLARELEEAKAKVRGTVNVDFKDQKTEANYVETAVMFAKDFSRLTAEQVNQLKELLKKFESSGEYQNGSESV